MLEELFRECVLDAHTRELYKVLRDKGKKAKDAWLAQHANESPEELRKKLCEERPVAHVLSEEEVFILFTLLLCVRRDKLDAYLAGKELLDKYGCYNCKNCNKNECNVVNCAEPE